MSTFFWDDNFLTGHQLVDEQHLELIHRFGKFAEALADGELEPDESFDAMRSYAQNHFRQEAALMAQEAVDRRHQHAHLQGHAQFLEQLDSLWQARQTFDDAAHVFLEFLCSWLSVHILRVDKELMRQVALIGNGHSATTAYEQTLAECDAHTTLLRASIDRLYWALSQQNLQVIKANLALRRSNQHLEETIAARTAELERTNAELASAVKRLTELARVDAALGIANRTCFEERYEEQWRRAARFHSAIAVLMIDVDHFKEHNDRHGHQAGDQCLRSVAQAISGELRRGGDLVARYGGDEVIVVLPDTDQEGARHQAEQIRRRVEGLNLPGFGTAAVTVSIGVCSMVAQSDMCQRKLIALADKALYQAKSGGRNRVVTCTQVPDVQI